METPGGKNDIVAHPYSGLGKPEALK